MLDVFRRRLIGRRPLGFSLMEILVALGIVSVLAAILLPSLNSFLSNSRSQRLIETIHGVRKGIWAFKADTYNYPLSLQQLITPPAPGDLNICGLPIPQSRLDRWRGPYLQRDVLPIIDRDDTVKTDLSRRDAGKGDDQAYLRITVQNVDSVTALKLDELQGEDGNLKSGNVQWKRVKGQGYAPRLFFERPIRGC